MFKCIYISALGGFIAGATGMTAAVTQGKTIMFNLEDKPAQVVVGALIGASAGLVLGIVGYALKVSCFTSRDDLNDGLSINSDDSEGITAKELYKQMLEQNSEEDELGTLVVVHDSDFYQLETAFYDRLREANGPAIQFAVELEDEYGNQ